MMRAEAVRSSTCRIEALRLLPGDDLRRALERWASRVRPRAAFVVTTVGSLRRARLRLADARQAVEVAGPLEIVSLVGTLSRDGVHLHCSLADAQGRVTGGHVMPGCEIHTTAEIVIGIADGLRFARCHDARTGYRELEVRRLLRRP